MVKEWLVPLSSVISVTIMVCYALHLGIDGILLALAIGGVCGLGGYEIKPVITKVKELVRK